jgi:hypothetical protein
MKMDNGLAGSVSKCSSIEFVYTMWSSIGLEICSSERTSRFASFRPAAISAGDVIGSFAPANGADGVSLSSIDSASVLLAGTVLDSNTRASNFPPWLEFSKS